jgi:DNA-binding GntR family transcriptional regulator
MTTAGKAKKATPAKTTANSAPLKHARGSGAETVYHELRREILFLDLDPGTLLDETELANRFRLSRSPIREALIRLSSEGLVQTLRNRSTIVAPFDVAAIPSFLDAVELIFRLTAGLAARNRRPSHLARFKELQTAMEEASRRADTVSLMGLRYDFHMTIAAASGNVYYEKWTREVLEQGQRLIRAYQYTLDDHSIEDVDDEHSALVAAIEKQDVDAAEDAARRDAALMSKQTMKWLTARPSAQFELAGKHQH